MIGRTLAARRSASALMDATALLRVPWRRLPEATPRAFAAAMVPVAEDWLQIRVRVPRLPLWPREKRAPVTLQTRLNGMSHPVAMHARRWARIDSREALATGGYLGAPRENAHPISQRPSISLTTALRGIALMGPACDLRRTHAHRTEIIRYSGKTGSVRPITRTTRNDPKATSPRSEGTTNSA
jgi:hypothetical protein